MWVWDQFAAVLDYAQSHLVLTLVTVFVATLALSFLHATLTPPPQPAVYRCALPHVFDRHHDMGIEMRCAAIRRSQSCRRLTWTRAAHMSIEDFAGHFAKQACAYTFAMDTYKHQACCKKLAPCVHPDLCVCLPTAWTTPLTSTHS